MIATYLGGNIIGYEFRRICTPALEKLLYVPVSNRSRFSLILAAAPHPIFEESHICSTAPPSIAPARETLARIGSKELVRPNRDGFRAFGVVAQGQARYAQYGGFLGDVTRIRNHPTCMLHQVVEF